MALIPFGKVIERYWSTVSYKYPNVDYDHFCVVCKSPFKFIRKQMARADLPTILIKYWGKMRVFRTTVIKKKRAARKACVEGRITPERYEEVKANLNEKLSHLEIPKRRK